jgi:thiol-disulfide isomerase/thioredoxin
MKNIIITIIILVAIIVGINMFSSQDSALDMTTETSLEQHDDATPQDEMELNDDTEISDDTNSDETMDDDSADQNISGSVVQYTETDIATLSGNIVLNFSASWCPSCRALKSNIEENMNNIPSDLTIVYVDYDNSTDLKRKYGVTRQHTLVQVDSQGGLVDKWSGGTTLDSIVSRVQ